MFPKMEFASCYNETWLSSKRSYRDESLRVKDFHLHLYLRLHQVVCKILFFLRITEQAHERRGEACHTAVCQSEFLKSRVISLEATVFGCAPRPIDSPDFKTNTRELFEIRKWKLVTALRNQYFIHSLHYNENVKIVYSAAGEAVWCSTLLD